MSNSGGTLATTWRMWSGVPGLGPKTSMKKKAAELLAWAWIQSLVIETNEASCVGGCVCVCGGRTSDIRSGDSWYQRREK